MNFYNIKCFITLAEELNFTRASEKLFISQPTLSKIISTLENELNVPLFTRNKKSVQLTTIGKQFYTDCTNIFEQYTESIQLCHAMKQGIKGRVKIGFIAAPMRQHLQVIANTCAIYCPEVQLEYVEDRQHMLLKYLVAGDIDLALFCNWNITTLYKEFQTHTIYKDHYCVIANKHHPLADRQSISISDLKEETFIVCKSPNSIREFTLFEHADNSTIIRNLCSNAGFPPKISASALTMDGMLMIVASGSGITIGAKHLQRQFPELAFIPIEDEQPEFRGIMSWRTNAVNPAVPPIVDVIKDLFP